MQASLIFCGQNVHLVQIRNFNRKIYDEFIYCISKRNCIRRMKYVRCWGESLIYISADRTFLFFARMLICPCFVNTILKCKGYRAILQAISRSKLPKFAYLVHGKTLMSIQKIERWDFDKMSFIICLKTLKRNDGFTDLVFLPSVKNEIFSIIHCYKFYYLNYFPLNC